MCRGAFCHCRRTPSDRGFRAYRWGRIGLNAFERNAKGTARSFADQPEGYHFPLYRKTSLATVTTPTSIVVWVDAHAAKEAGLDIANASDQKALKKMLAGLDKSHSMGGALLEDSKLEWCLPRTMSWYRAITVICLR